MRFRVFRYNLGHRSVNHRQKEACQTVHDHRSGRIDRNTGEDEIRHSSAKQPHGDHPFRFDLITDRTIDQLSDRIENKI